MNNAKVNNLKTVDVDFERKLTNPRVWTATTKIIISVDILNIIKDIRA